MGDGQGEGAVVEAKGVTKFALNWLIRAVRRCGHVSPVVQCDAETSIIALCEKVVTSTGGSVRQAPVRSHSSNGGVERGKRGTATVGTTDSECTMRPQ